MLTNTFLTVWTPSILFKRFVISLKIIGSLICQFVILKKFWSDIIHFLKTSLLLKLGKVIISKVIPMLITKASLIATESPITLNWDRYVDRFCFNVDDAVVKLLLLLKAKVYKSILVPVLEDAFDFSVYTLATFPNLEGNDKALTV